MLIAHLQLLQGSGGHVGILEVDEGTETLMKNSDALYLTKPVTTQNTELPTFSNKDLQTINTLSLWYTNPATTADSDTTISIYLSM